MKMDTFAGNFGTNHGRETERGAVLFLLALVVLILSIGAAIAVDLNVVSSRGQRLQNAADAASLAGVQALRAPDGGRDAAQTAVEDLLRQNGIDIGGTTTLVVRFPDEDNDTQVEVILSDTDPGTLLSGVTGSDSVVDRSATATFDSCAASCFQEVEIPRPFRSVEADGSGDGYKPIIIGSELYAINHNHGGGDIVCIDRNTADDTEIEGVCAGWPAANQSAYASSVNQRNPEMPHTAVIDTTIYWTGSNETGTHLYCFQTATNQPCADSFPVNNERRATTGNQKDRNRGGGTVLAGDRIFVFTDDHRVHCFERPSGLSLDRCQDYEDGELSFLGADGFPAATRTDGNHGSSIDRIVDEAAGKIYWTLHVPMGPVPPTDCSQDNLEFPSGVVSIQNAGSDLFMRVDAATERIEESGTNTDADTHWVVKDEGMDGLGLPRYSFRNVATGLILDSDGGEQAPLDTSDGVGPDDRWSFQYQNTTSTLFSSEYGTYATESGTEFVTQAAVDGNFSGWIIRHPDCFDPNFTPIDANTAVPHSAGTWLQCWSLVNNAPCTDFTPSAIHSDASRFSGRLFFHRSGTDTPSIQGVCSTGYADTVDVDNFELVCVNNANGSLDEDLSDNMASFETAIDTNTLGNPAAWGDPHYHEDSNRLFYPTAHNKSRLVCWDFDLDDPGLCGVRTQLAAEGGLIEDYGYVSDENGCVYGLGHTSRFYAFQAEDIEAVCNGATAFTQISPCDCSGDWEWGTLTFDVDLALFDEFLIQVFNSNKDLVFPRPTADDDDPSHSLHDDGLTIDLNGLPVLEIDPELDFLEIVVTVNAEDDPWALGDQTFAIEFERAPRLSE